MASRWTAWLLAAVMALTFAAGAVAEEYPVLSRGSRDSAGAWAVFSLQRKLVDLKYLSAEPDGVYGAGTENAVRAFQEANGLEATGIADDETQQLLFASAAETDAETEPDEPVIEQGARSNEVSIIQSYMLQWGFTTDSPDGKYGAATRKALTDFMKYAYDDMLEYTRARRAEATPAPTPSPTPGAMAEMADVLDVAITPEPTIPADGTITQEWFDYIEHGFDPIAADVAPGDSGAEVRRMQRRLATLQYVAAGIDGGFGAHTEVALKYFQRRNNLTETGVLDRATQEALYSSMAVSSDKFVSMYKTLVSIDDQRVYIYKWTGSDYTELLHTFICTTGKESTPTILGTYQAAGRNGDWFYFKESRVWAKYAFVIEGGYFFHSVLYKQKDGQPTSSSINQLGSRASNGCIRLQVEDAKWIYDNCAAGMTIVIYEDE